MHTSRSKKSIVSLFTLFLLLSFSGSVHGFVLCYGPEDHMHIETTFNGVDCGHFPPSPLQANGSQYLATESPFSATPCYACTDIPLASPHYLLQNKSVNSNAHNRRILSTMADLAFPSFSLLFHRMPADQSASPPTNSYCPLTQSLSSVLRI